MVNVIANLFLKKIGGYDIEMMWKLWIIIVIKRSRLLIESTLMQKTTDNLKIHWYELWFIDTN